MTTAPTSDTMEVDTAPFRLLDLPAELRLHIYEALLFDAESYILPVANLPPARPNRSKSIHPAILRTCKTVYHEALPVLYSTNTFMIRTFPLQYCVPQLTAYIRGRNSGLIRRVFTVGREGAKLEEQKLKEKYEAMGLQWAKLHIWACRGLERGITERWIADADDGGWIEDVDLAGMRKLGLRGQWFDFAQELQYDDTKGSGWVIRKGSTKRAD